MQVLFEYVYKFDGIGIHNETFERTKDKQWSLKVEIEPIWKGDQPKVIDIEVSSDIKLGQIWKLVADSCNCNPAELLIKNKTSYLAEVLMYDRLSQYSQTNIITFWYRT